MPVCSFKVETAYSDGRYRRRIIKVTSTNNINLVPGTVILLTGEPNVGLGNSRYPNTLPTLKLNDFPEYRYIYGMSGGSTSYSYGQQSVSTSNVLCVFTGSQWVGINHYYTHVCSDSCFVAGTKVIVFSDGVFSLKSIETIKVGEIVLGANMSFNRVSFVERTNMSDKHDIVTFEDKSLSFTDHHIMWVRKNAKEYWGVYAYKKYYERHCVVGEDGLTVAQREQKTEYDKNHIDKGIRKELKVPCMDIGKECEFGSVWGYVQHKVVVDERYKPGTEVYNLIVDGSHSYYANGYLVSGKCDDSDYDYSKVEIEVLKDEILDIFNEKD